MRQNRPFGKLSGKSGSGGKESVKKGFRSWKKSFIFQGSLLAIASIIVRLIGMLYRVPLTAIIGTEGNGYYTSAYSIYTLLLIISSFSMPTAISKLVSGNLQEGFYKNNDRILKVAFLYATIAGGMAFCLLFFGAVRIADLLQKPFLVFALRALAPTVWIMAYLGILRGYFQGSGNMVPTAVSQILEQIVNAIVSVLMAGILFRMGQVSDMFYQETEYSFAFGAAGGSIGTGAGAFSALIFFIILFMKRRPRDRELIHRDIGPLSTYAETGIILISTMLPILIASTVYNVSSVIDDYIFANLSAYLGTSEKIVSEWGIFGEYHILFNIPVALANALSSSLIPSLTRAVKEGNRRKIQMRIRSAVRFTMLIAIPSSIGLLVFSYPIAGLLFPENALRLSRLTMIGAFAVAVYSLSTITNAILQGLSHLSRPLINALISLFIHCISLVVMMLLGMSIYAVVVSNIIFALSMCVLNQLSIRKYIAFSQGIMTTYLIPLLSGIIMAFSGYGFYMLTGQVIKETAFQGRVYYGLRLMPSIMFSVLVYFLSLILFKGIKREDLDGMPFGGRLKRFIR